MPPFFTALGASYVICALSHVLQLRSENFDPIVQRKDREAQRSCFRPLPLLKGLLCGLAVRTEGQMPLGGRFLLSLRMS